MKFIYLIISTFLFNPVYLFADEGMWLPLLLKQLNEKKMQSAGLKISAEDIYSVNRSSLKDAVALFGRGCTGEIISNEGLLLTNHHCGFSQIQDHSTLENDYLKNGFWAKTKENEMTNPGLSVSFLIRMEDVTEAITQDLYKLTDENARENIVAQRSLEIVKKAIAGTHYEASVKPMYNGNEYYLFVMEVFKDVRLVGAPPSSIGKFGKDEDNWSWPRHTGDFSLFRIYAGKDNKPAEYSKDNIPFTPRYVMPICTTGVNENDFTMVYGFPGRTNEYLTSYAVEQLITISNPIKVDLRGKRLEVMNRFMEADREIFLKYADKYSSISNYHKKWKGETKGLLKANAIDKKRSFERLFENRVNADEQYLRYLDLIPEIKKQYDALEIIQPELDLFNEGLFVIELFKFTNSFATIANVTSEEISSDKTKELIKNLQSISKSFFKDYYAPIDREIATDLINTYYKKTNLSASPDFIPSFRKGFAAEDLKLAVDQLFEQSFLDEESEVSKFLNDLTVSGIARLKNDPVFQLVNFYNNFYKENILNKYNEINKKLIPLNRSFVKAQREVITEKQFYPDANSTLRIAYGKIEGYAPNDAVTFEWNTTGEGILQKNNTEHSDYAIEPRMKMLLENKDFGNYAEKNGALPICFAASNHTTGGNSGSPVLNAKGHLIGTNFDRNWEGTMSDIYYDINQVRNIVLDVRYTLWVIDKYAEAGHLIKEMQLVK
jgi:hypothetical protein